MRFYFQTKSSETKIVEINWFIINFVQNQAWFEILKLKSSWTPSNFFELSLGWAEVKLELLKFQFWAELQLGPIRSSLAHLRP